MRNRRNSSMKKESVKEINDIMSLFPLLQQAEKLKSREMKEGWMKNDEC